MPQPIRSAGPPAKESADSRRASIATLIAIMVLGHLALWTLVPAAWLWLTRDLSATRFVISVPGCAISMFGAGAPFQRQPRLQRA